MKLINFLVVVAIVAATVFVGGLLPIAFPYPYQLHTDGVGKWELFDGHSPVNFENWFFVAEYGDECLVVASENGVRFFAKNCQGSPEMSGGILFHPYVMVRHEKELQKLSWERLTQEEAAELVMEFVNNPKAVRYVN